MKKSFIFLTCNYYIHDIFHIQKLLLMCIIYNIYVYIQLIFTYESSFSAAHHDIDHSFLHGGFVWYTPNFKK